MVLFNLILFYQFIICLCNISLNKKYIYYMHNLYQRVNNLDSLTFFCGSIIGTDVCRSWTFLKKRSWTLPVFVWVPWWECVLVPYLTEILETLWNEEKHVKNIILHFIRNFSATHKAWTFLDRTRPEIWLSFGFLKWKL